MPENNYPKLHNATWPGIVGKGSDEEPIISFDTMLEKTAAAEVDGVRFDGVDLGLFVQHYGSSNFQPTRASLLRSEPRKTRCAKLYALGLCGPTGP